MLTIYDNIGLVPEGCIQRNGAFFNTDYLLGNFKVDPTIERFMEIIDKAVPKQGKTMDTPYANGISMSYLSTGCKTAINIYSFPDMVFDSLECGDNALLEILKLDRGMVVIGEPPVSYDDFDIDINYVTEHGTFHCTRYSEYKKIWINS